MVLTVVYVVDVTGAQCEVAISGSRRRFRRGPRSACHSQEVGPAISLRSVRSDGGKEGHGKMEFAVSEVKVIKTNIAEKKNEKGI